METQIVYVVISEENDLYLEELWASVYSLRYFHPETKIVVLADEPTATRLYERNALATMITEIKVVSTPKEYNSKQRSREIKTTIRQVIEGDYLFIDTDTIISQPLNCEDFPDADISAVPDEHVRLNHHPFGQHTIDTVYQVFGEDVSDSEYWFNSGVMYVRDTPIAHKLYKRWNENWRYSCFEKGNSQDQPSLIKTDKEFGYIIRCLPDEYNCQLALSVRHLHDAKIVHFWHMDFIADQSYSPFMGLEIYRRIKADGAISNESAHTILHCKSAFNDPTMIVGWLQIQFLFSPFCQGFIPLYSRSQRWQNFLNAIATFISRIRKAKKKLFHYKLR